MQKLTLPFIKSLVASVKKAGWLFTPAAFVFLGYFAWQSRSLLVSIAYSVDTIQIALCVLLWTGLHLIAPLFTKIILLGLSSSITYGDAFIIYAGRLPAKYLPGGIWHTVARATDYYRYNISPRQISAYLVIENICAAAVTLFIGGLIVYANTDTTNILRPILLMATLSGIAMIIFLPWLIDKYILRNINQLDIKLFIIGLALTLTSWSLASIAFTLFINAFDSLVVKTSVFNIIGVYLFSWGVGFLSIFAPQGIGVTEYISSQLLDASITTGGFLVFLASFRFIILIADILTWLISQSYKLIQNDHG